MGEGIHTASGAGSQTRRNSETARQMALSSLAKEAAEYKTRDSDYGRVTTRPPKALLEKMLDNGATATYRKGYAFKGAKEREVTAEEAKEKLKTYSYGKGFYELSYETRDGRPHVHFNEYSANDLY